MAGGVIGLIAACVAVGGLILAGYLVYYLSPTIGGLPPPGIYFNPFFQILMFLSVLCALFLIITFAVFGENGKIRTYPIKLIMFLCGALVVAFTTFMISSQDVIVNNNVGCFIVALLSHYGFLAIFCWTFCIAFNFYRMIVAQDRDTRSYEKWYHLASWGFPAIVIIILGAIEQYGRVPGTSVCFIKSDVARLVGFFVPGLLIVAANTVLFVFVAREIRETLKGAQEIRGAGEKKDLKRQLRVYISIVFSIGLAWVFGFIFTLLALIDPNTTRVPAQIFEVLFNVFVPLQGFFLFGSYCVNEKIFKKYAAAFGCSSVVSKLDYLATSSTQGTSASKGSQSKTGSKTSSSSSRDVEMTSSSQSGTDSRF